MGEELKEKLFTKKEDGWKNLTTSQKEELVIITENYMKFLNKSKIEREFIKNAKELADRNGYTDIMNKQTLVPGDKVYFINRGKSMYLAIIGENDIEEK